jgi:DNA-directed RNA polymerase subunit RPC12/RpoP
MPYDFRCNTCHALLETEDRWVGREAVCPGCGAKIFVPRKNTVIQQTKPCPNCGEQMKQNDVICEGCSFNIMTGKIKKRHLGYKIYRRKKIKNVTKKRVVINYPAVTLQFTCYTFLLFLGIGTFLYLLMPNGRAGLYVALALVCGGWLCGFYAYFMWLWAWLKTGFMWFLLCFLFAPVNLVYILIHWDRAKYPLGMSCLAVAMVFAGAALAGPRLGEFLTYEPRLLAALTDFYIVDALDSHPREFTEEEIKELDKPQFDVNQIDEMGWTPLQRAVYFDNKELVEKIILKKADIDVALADNFSPLMIAGMKGYKEIVPLLLEAGANPMAKNGSGQTALTLTFDPAIKKMMIQAVNDAKEKEKKGK